MTYDSLGKRRKIQRMKINKNALQATTTKRSWTPLKQSFCPWQGSENKEALL